MKKVTFLSLWVLLLGFVFASCEKAVLDDESNSESQSSNVVIRVSDIETGWAGAESRALVNVSEVCSRLCFAVYQDGSRKTYKNQKTGDSDFGSYSLSLDAGTYQLLVVGHSGAANPTTTSPSKVQFTNPSSSGGTGFTTGYLSVPIGEKSVMAVASFFGYPSISSQFPFFCPSSLFSHERYWANAIASAIFPTPGAP